MFNKRATLDALRVILDTYFEMNKILEDSVKQELEQ